jgi:hypothetical protein
LEPYERRLIVVRPVQRILARPDLRLQRIFVRTIALAIFVCAACPQIIIACEQVPAGQTFRIRLLQPIASYSSTPGTVIRGFVIESPYCEGLPVLRTGTLVEGHIVSVQKVGLGFRHETSSLRLEIDRVIEGDVPVEIRASVLAVDNAGQKVKGGVIRGGRSTKTFHGVLGNTLGYVMMWHPASFWIVPATRATFSAFPEPELYFPAGTDLLLQLYAPMPVAASERLASQHQEFSRSEISELDQQVLLLPERTSTLKGQQADVVNLAFVGSQHQLERAFQSAGWVSSDAMSGWNGIRQYTAFAVSHTYAHSPMSRQLLEGNASDFSLEKGLNSVAKRDHLRVWGEPVEWKDSAVWLGSSTRDVGIVWMLRDKKFVHRIEPDIDVERERIVRDLTLAGCVESVYHAQRRAMPASMVNATGDKLLTDGAVAVVQLKDCEAPDFADVSQEAPLVTRPPTKLARYVRVQVLSFRDLWRENAAYNAFDLSRMAVRSWRRKHDAARAVTALLPQPVNHAAVLPN